MENVSLFGLFRKYKDILLPIVFLLASVFIFLQIALPNITTITSLREEVAVQQEKLNEFQNSYDTLTSLDETKLDQNITTATQALPATKNIDKIYLAITASAADSGVEVSGYSVQVGDVYQKGANRTGGATPQTVTVSVSVANVDAVTLEAFTKALLTQFPMSRISRVGVVSTEGDINIGFYFIPYNLALINTEIITPLSPAETQTLSAISF